MKIIAWTLLVGLCVAAAACGASPKPEDPSSTATTYGASSGSASEGPSNSAGIPSGTPDTTTAPGTPQAAPK